MPQTRAFLLLSSSGQGGKRASLSLELLSPKRTQLGGSRAREVASSVDSEVDALDSIVEPAQVRALSPKHTRYTNYTMKAEKRQLDK
jgi:hypothetical protein